MNEVIIDVAWSLTDSIHVGSQGSWQIARSSSPTPRRASLVCGYSLTGLVYQTDGVWCAVQILGDPSKMEILSDAQTCRFRFESGGESLLDVTRCEFSDWDDCVGWFRTQLGLDQFAPLQRRFSRAYCLDVHDSIGDLQQSYAEIQQFVDLARTHDLARDAIFYLPGWDGKYDATYPNYTASSEAGGWSGLAELVANVREAGGELLPHLNHWGLSQEQLSGYPSLSSELYRDSSGTPLQWPGAMWCGATNPLFYVRPDSEIWMEIMEERIARLRSYGINAFFLDQIGAPGNGENLRMVRSFSKRVCPSDGISLYGSELPIPELTSHFKLAQMWGPPWCGTSENRHLSLSPLLAEVYEPFTQLFGHLGTPAPYPSRYAWTNYVFLAEHGTSSAFEIAWRQHEAAKVLPTLRIDSRRMTENRLILEALADGRMPESVQR